MNGKCNTCGTPMSKNRFKEIDCPNCNSDKFVGFNPTKNETPTESKKSLNLNVVDFPEFIENNGKETFVEIEEI
jgi:hypothetical protein